MKSDGELFQPNAMLAHHLINRFAVIVGYCDLMLQETPADPERSRRLHLMRDIANSAAEELVERQYHRDRHVALIAGVRCVVQTYGGHGPLPVFIKPLCRPEQR